ncbi:MAG TPA: glycoside hydrolase family 18 protein, partial [Verrucomicrobiae bacterium]|nr:glycoside hydrolase family 18 protein [Verrucomicrobiae bacterium]
MRPGLSGRGRRLPVVMLGFRRSARAILFAVLSMLLASAARGGSLWTTGYYPGYRQTYLPPSAIDFKAVTHIIHFAVAPNLDGTLDTTANGITAARSADLVTRAHAAGVKVLICVGGAGSQAGFQGATSTANLSTFVANLVNFVAARSYDGVDVDWEPLEAQDLTQFINFTAALRAGLKQQSASSLLSAAAASQPDLFASLQDRFDQINLMTYDLAGPWPGWVTWFNSPIFDGGSRFPSTGGLIPSVDGMVNDFLRAGVSSRKLGIGIAFYGYLWAGVALPRQSWSTPPSTTAIAFSDLMAGYYQSNLYHWDTNAQAAYLSIQASGTANDKFISYDDEHTCQAKVSYARNRFLGGVMVWELGEG